MASTEKLFSLTIIIEWAYTPGCIASGSVPIRPIIFKLLDLFPRLGSKKIFTWLRCARYLLSIRS